MLLPSDFAQGRVGALVLACVILQCWLFAIMRKGTQPDAGYLGLSSAGCVAVAAAYDAASMCIRAREPNLMLIMRETLID